MRMQRAYAYTEVDGNHFPDLNVGDEVFCAISMDPWLDCTESTITEVIWELPVDVIGSQDLIDGSIIGLKLNAIKVGVFEIVAKVTSVGNGITQVNSVPMMLKVF